VFPCPSAPLPREIKVLCVYRDLERWDELFIEIVARNGILMAY
jgi:hypothetical protein